MQRILIAILLGMALVLLAVFGLFAAWQEKDDREWRIILTITGLFALFGAVVTVIGVMTC